MATKKSAPSVSINTELEAASKALDPAIKRLKKDLAKLDLKKLPGGAVADLLYDLRAVKSMLNALTKPLEEVLDPCCKEIEEHFIQTLEIGESSGLQGMHSRVQITESVVPVVQDWDKFYAHIQKTKSFELLNRAVNRKAVEERWENKKQVPGVDKFHAKKVSCTKLSGKEKK